MRFTKQGASVKLSENFPDFPGCSQTFLAFHSHFPKNYEF